MRIKGNSQLGIEIRHQLQESYPTLHVVDEAISTIQGSFPVKAEGKVVDHYLIEIRMTQAFPKEPPLVRELGGRIKRELDWHTSEDGNLCLFSPLERWKHLPDSATLVEFLEGPLNDFLFSQSYFEMYGVWPFGERGHGKWGIKEYLTEELGTSDVTTMTQMLDYLCQENPKGHWSCYCGSGKKLRHCHFDKIVYLREKITTKEAKYALEIFNRR
jgi:hypothetical protein